MMLSQVPVRGSILYFTIAELASVDGMYQYSLTYFTRLFSHCLEAAEPGADLSKRLENLINFSTQHIYKMVCRGLFDAHKLVFAFLVATSFERHSGDISNAHWNFLIRGGHSESTGTANPAPEWITPAMWQVRVLATPNRPLCRLVISAPMCLGSCSD